MTETIEIFSFQYFLVTEYLPSPISEKNLTDNFIILNCILSGTHEGKERKLQNKKSFSFLPLFFFYGKTVRESYVDKGREAPMTTSTNPPEQNGNHRKRRLIANGRDGDEKKMADHGYGVARGIHVLCRGEGKESVGKWG